MNKAYHEDDDYQMQEYGVGNNQLKKGEISALDLFNTPHNYIRMSIPYGRRNKPRAIAAKKKPKKKSAYRRKF